MARIGSGRLTLSYEMDAYDKWVEMSYTCTTKKGIGADVLPQFISWSHSASNSDGFKLIVHLTF